MFRIYGGRVKLGRDESEAGDKRSMISQPGEFSTTEAPTDPLDAERASQLMYFGSP